jgi:YMGG-like Gly-zipper
MSRRFFSAALSLICALTVSMLAQAQHRRVYRNRYQTQRQVILRLESRSTLFRDGVQAWLDSNPNVAYSANADINLFTRDFEDSVRRLRDHFDRREAAAADVQEVLNRAGLVDDFMRQNPMDARTQSYWSSMRVDLNQLASLYNLTWPTTTSASPPYGNRPYDNRLASQLTGTYRIDPSRSEDAREAADMATRDLSYNERQRVLDSVTRRLEPPDQIAIDVRGRSVTIASTRAPQITFDADGREQLETNANGRTIRSRATLSANQLMVSTSGDTGNDFSVTFDAMDNGQRLNVTRRVFAQGLTRPVIVRTVYDKTSEVAQFSIYNERTYPTSQGGFIVPDGVQVVAILDNALSTRTAAVGDRFTLRVSQPAEFEGSTIEGHVSHVERSGRLTGRSIMTLDFDNIRLRDGRSYRFAGLVEGVRTANGETVRIDTEGTVRDQSQTRKTEERAVIGTGVGAIIGAIAGGGKGAAIGAILGAGVGAGSVYVEGRNDLDLARGTEITIRSGAPANTPR